MEQRKQNQKLFRELFEDAKRRAIQPAPKRQEFVDIPRMKMVRDGVMSIPKESISAPQIAVDLIRNEISIQHNHHGDGIEVMVLILLNVDNYPILTKTVGIGSTNHVMVDPKQVFSIVLSPLFLAHGFILGHNHPSGKIFLSDEDKLILEEFRELGQRLNTPMRDFIVVGDGTDKYYSHRNENYEL
jgi:DNA repair protein RadC